MPTTLRPRSLKDFRPGDTVQTRARTVTEADLVAFAGVTWDFYPLHTDEEYARSTRFGTRIAHGPLIYSMSIGLMPLDFFGDAIVAFLGVDKLRHVAPVYVGDTIEVHATVREARETSSGTTGVVSIDYATKNQKAETVLEMTALFLMRGERSEV
jgi:3-hydroxybutyryl-CoA dehydratase